MRNMEERKLCLEYPIWRPVTVGAARRRPERSEGPESRHTHRWISLDGFVRLNMALVTICRAPLKAIVEQISGWSRTARYEEMLVVLRGLCVRWLYRCPRRRSP